MPIFLAQFALLRFDDDYVYVFEDGKKVRRIAKSDHHVDEIDASPLIRYDAAAVRDGVVYACGEPRTCVRARVGQPAERLDAGAEKIGRITVGDHAMYVVTDQAAVLRVPLDGKPPKTLVPAEPYAMREIAPLGDKLVITELLQSPDRQPVWELWTTSKRDGGHTVVAHLGGPPFALEANGTDVVLLLDPDRLVKLHSPGGPLLPVAKVPDASAAHMIVHAGQIYLEFANPPATLYRVNQTHGTIEKVRGVPDYARLLAVDDKTVWLEGRHGLLAAPLTAAK